MAFWNFLKKKKTIYTPLNEETIKRDEIIKAQQQKIMTQEAQISNVIAKEKEKKDKLKDKDIENEQNKKLVEQELDLRANRFGKQIKLDKFYYDMFVKNKNVPGKKYWRKQTKGYIELTDKNDEIVFGYFGGIGILEGGKLCIYNSEGEIMSYGKTLQHILYKPDAFENMVRRGRFTLPMDKDGNFTEDLEYKEMPEPIDAVYDEETGTVKRIIWSKVKTSEVKKIITDKMELINNLQNELERNDSIIVKLKQDADSSKRALNIYKNESEISHSELSKSIYKFVETEKRLGDLHTQVTKLTELKAMYELLIMAKDNQIDKIISKLDSLTDPEYEKIKDMLKDDLEFYKAILPERVEVKQENLPEIKLPVQPGEKIK